MKKYNLERFITAQQSYYAAALNEVKNGLKTSHWMWYIFPQVKGLGTSHMSLFYGIEDLDEAVAFLQNEYLRCNLYRICEALMQLETNDAKAVFGYIDAKKLKSSMTLFAYAAGTHSIFHDVLDKFFEGRFCGRTKGILNLD